MTWRTFKARESGLLSTHSLLPALLVCALNSMSNMLVNFPPPPFPNLTFLLPLTHPCRFPFPLYRKLTNGKTEAEALDLCHRRITAALCFRLTSAVFRKRDATGRHLYPVFYQLPTEKELPLYYELIKEVRQVLSEEKSSQVRQGKARCLASHGKVRLTFVRPRTHKQTD